MSIAPICTCGASIYYCNGSVECKKAIRVSGNNGIDKKLKLIEEAIRATIVIQNPQGLPFCMEKIKEILTIN